MDILTDTDKALWQKCVDFHGHICGGLTIGYKAALLARELLGLNFSHDEEIVCISENDSCAVDALQVALGCTIGKGNLLFHMTGKQAYSFYDRNSQKSLRLILKNRSKYMSREESLDYFSSHDARDLFDIKEVSLPLPNRAQIFESYVCENCHEETGSKWIRTRDGKKLCLDCVNALDL